MRLSAGTLTAIVAVACALGFLLSRATVREGAAIDRPQARGGAGAYACPEAPAAVVAAAKTADPSAQLQPPASAAGSPEIARYTVCEREETRAALAPIALARKGADLWALHCGGSLHLIAFSQVAGTLVPQRVARLQIASSSPAEAPAALETIAADVNGDGRNDWIAPVLLVDAGGAPRGGGLYLLPQRAEGGFARAQRLLAAAPGALVAAELDAQPGQDLVLLQRSHAAAGDRDELWSIAGGPAPLRIARRPAGVEVRAIAALDLDLDGRDDLAAASAREGRVRLWLSSVGIEPALRGGSMPAAGALAQVEPTELELNAVQQLLAADVDGDGRRELVITGERSWLLAASADRTFAPAAIDGSPGVRDLHGCDADGDGRIDLVGYAHPDLIVLRAAADGRFERERVLSLRGEASVLFARLAQLDADRRPDLIVAMLAAGDARQVELGIATNVDPGTTLRLAGSAAAISDTALLQRFDVF